MANTQGAGDTSLGALLGLLAFALWVLAAAEAFGYFTTAQFQSWTPTEVGVVAFIVTIAAGAVYYRETE